MARGAHSTSNYFSVGSTPITAAPFTVAFWAYPLVDNADMSAFGLSDTGGASDYFTMRFTPGGDFNPWTNTAGGGSETVGGAFTKLAWHHYAFVVNSPTSRYAYIDGVPGAHSTFSRVPAGIDTLSAGALKRTSVGNAFNGYLAEIGLWNYGLSTTQILAQSNGVEPAMIQRANLQGFWRATPGSGNLIDVLGNYDLTESGTAVHQTHPLIARAKILVPGQFGFARRFAA